MTSTSSIAASTPSPRSLGVAVSDLTDLHLVPLAGKDAVMGAPERKSGLVAPTAVFRGLVALVEKINPVLVVLDALADVFGGEEIARTQARQFISLLRGLAIDNNLAVVLIAHPSLTGMKEGTSGSTAWSNSVRSRLYLERVKDGEREIDANRRVLSVKKSNYGPVGLELRLRWSNGAFVLDGPASGFDKLAAEAKADRVFLDLLAAFAAQERDVSPKPGPTYAPSVFAKHPDSDGVSKADLARAMERLLKGKEIRVATKGPPSKERQRLVREFSQRGLRVNFQLQFQPPSNTLPTPPNGGVRTLPHTPWGVGTRAPVGTGAQRRGVRVDGPFSLRRACVVGGRGLVANDQCHASCCSLGEDPADVHASCWRAWQAAQEARTLAPKRHALDPSRSRRNARAAVRRAVGTAKRARSPFGQGSARRLLRRTHAPDPPAQAPWTPLCHHRNPRARDRRAHPAQKTCRRRPREPRRPTKVPLRLPGRFPEVTRHAKAVTRNAMKRLWPRAPPRRDRRIAVDDCCAHTAGVRRRLGERAKSTLSGH